MAKTSRINPQARLFFQSELGNLFPGLGSGAFRGSDFGGGKAKQFGQFLGELGAPIRSIVAGLPGVTSTIRLPSGEILPELSTGEVVLPDGTTTTAEAINAGSLLPPIRNIPTDTTTLFEAQQAGTTTDFEKKLFNQFNQVFSPEFGKNIGAGIGGISASASRGAANLDRVNVQDVGTITSQILGNLPTEIQSFVSRVFNDTSPQAMERELTNLSNALLAQAEQNVDSLGSRLLSRFAARGIGTGGSAIETIKQLGVEVATNVNAQIAAVRLSALQNLLDQRKTAVGLLDSLLGAGEAQRAQDVQGQIARIQAQAQIQAAALQVQGRIQEQLIATRGRLELGRLNLLSDTLGRAIQARQVDEATRIQQETLRTTFPNELAVRLATGGRVQPKSSGGGGFGSLGAGIGGVLKGGASIGSLFLKP